MNLGPGPEQAWGSWSELVNSNWQRRISHSTHRCQDQDIGVSLFMLAAAVKLLGGLLDEADRLVIVVPVKKDTSREGMDLISPKDSKCVIGKT